jgi:hypothetical protein
VESIERHRGLGQMAGDVFDLFIDGWNDVRHGSPPHDVAQAFLDALDARRREVSGNEGGDSDP